MESINQYVDGFFANELLSCDGPNDGHFDQLEDHDTANGALLFLVSLIVCISSFAGLAAYLQHGTAIMKWVSEVSSDDVFVSAVAVLFITLSIFVLVAEFQKSEAFLPISLPMEEQVEVAPLEIAVGDFILHCVVKTFNLVVGVVTFPGYTVKVLCRSVVAFISGS